jgi:hypothetical protein
MVLAFPEYAVYRTSSLDRRDVFCRRITGASDSEANAELMDYLWLTAAIAVHTFAGLIGDTLWGQEAESQVMRAAFVSKAQAVGREVNEVFRNESGFNDAQMAFLLQYRIMLLNACKRIIARDLQQCSSKAQLAAKHKNPRTNNLDKVAVYVCGRMT